MSRFDPTTLSSVVVICGHYGVGKTAFSLELARLVHAKGRSVTLVDLDIVNPYFRTSDFKDALKQEGIEVICPVYSGATNNLDSPSLTGAIAPAILRAQNDVTRMVILDVGGDDAGAFTLGRFAHEIAQGPYDMLYIVNAFRALTQNTDEMYTIMREVESASGLSCTGLVNNSHLMRETTVDHLKQSQKFAQALSARTDLPIVVQTMPQFLAGSEQALEGELLGETSYCIIDPYNQTNWDCL